VERLAGRPSIREAASTRNGLPTAGRFRLLATV
jgi:hypothetical protein